MKKNVENRIKNFVLNICCWQIENKGFYHRMSIHIQDVIPNFVIGWIVVNNGELSFDGCVIDSNGRFVQNESRSLNDISEEQLHKILMIIEGIDLFKS